MEDSPLTSFIYLGLGLAVLVFWLKELRQPSVDGEPFWPGALRTGWTPLAWGASGALAITLLETGLEVHLDITSAQSTIPAHFLMAMLGAAVVEEMAFRGFGAPGHLRGVKLIALAVGARQSSLCCTATASPTSRASSRQAHPSPSRFGSMPAASAH